MFVLPSLLAATEARPNRPPFEEPCRIPSPQKEEFWTSVYNILFAVKLKSPVLRKISSYVNPLFGYFGFRVHPVTHQARYFHVGLSLDLKSGRAIHPVREGILEYSGYGAINGHYVLLSHPDIRTEDGYIFHTMYCHLKKPLVRFNSYEKMLREISLGSYPLIEVSQKQVIGKASTTGLSRPHKPGLYLQFSFRKFGEQTIVIDPLRVYERESLSNQSADVIDSQEIENLFT